MIVAENIKKPGWIYALAGIVFVAVISLALLSDLWYRVVVLASLVSLFVYLYFGNRRIEKRLEQLKKEQLVEEIEINHEQEKTKEHDLEALREKEFQLQKLDLDRTQLFEELLSKTQLQEIEKNQIRDRLEQTESETSRVRQEWLNASSRLMSVVRGTKKLFVKESPMKEIAASMDEGILESGSFASLNNEIQRLLPRLSKESSDSLAKSNYIDEENQLTRSGYKALLQASEEDK
ncbi:uncharacterized protein YlbG (UPF0298 family) [Alkalihalobacillus xiaoxiensis]|uniref:Uncharacterized protein YlbG (UPF0298 family) n=1 Tax=Shouchella xiaoxiensis TaxID=766895 RepID=A0ABS2T179_9BACI|nr:hypothetical protein [Shouchella xiaoxiensis]MBM7840237.1 uncharacterized protein YlbG (UPF0298 family) [Shouchella xiaoxiensis]